MEKIKRNIIFSKSGGTARGKAISYKLSLPAQMVKDLKVCAEDKAVLLYFENNKIIIEKDNEEKDSENKIKRNIIFNKVGGNSGKDTISYKISLTNQIVKDIGVSEEDKTVLLYFENNKIIIEKNKGSEKL